MVPSPQPAAVKYTAEEPPKPVVIPKGTSRRPMTATPMDISGAKGKMNLKKVTVETETEEAGPATPASTTKPALVTSDPEEVKIPAIEAKPKEESKAAPAPAKAVASALEKPKAPNTKAPKAG